MAEKKPELRVVKRNGPTEVRAVAVAVSVRLGVFDGEGNLVQEMTTNQEQPAILYYPFDLEAHLYRVEEEAETAYEKATKK